MKADRMVLLLSGGIDSPVAGYLMGRQGIELVALTGFVNPEGDVPHIDKMGRLAGRISSAIGSKVELYSFAHRMAQSEFAHSPRPGLTCVLCKRMMLRVAERLAAEKGAGAIIMGDSLGQVASQTLQNMLVVEQAVRLPIVRPLVGLDKVEITRIAEEIGTYNLSNIKAAGCAFVPERPATKARLEEVLSTEERLDIGSLLSAAFKTVKLEGAGP